ncbi:alpha/beta hydrolase [Streptosporangium sp. NPDC020072]|uniref:alpha/beta fold hydrolase n=1 Tax=Streptosporangium sp. NPDC020072 TaxID=3154788 RepID=UPI00341813E4
MSLGRRNAMALGAGAIALAATGGAVPPASAAETGQAERGPAVPSDAELARSLPGGFTSRHAEVNGVRLHYVSGGSGEPLVLLPGWPQTWWEYRKVMPALAARYRVIVVDLRGMGGSGKPASGYDKKTMARDVRELVRALGHDRVNIAGHDVGAMIAFSFAVNHPEATRRLALLDVTHPDDSYYEFRMLPQPGQAFFPWWFAFNQVQGLPEQLVSGRSRYLVDWIFDHLLVDKSAIGDRDRAVYAKAYSSPDAVRGGNSWYQAFGQDIEDHRTYGKVTAPTLGLAHSAFHPHMNQVLPTQATDVRVTELTGTGHYFVEERPAAVIGHLTGFFG